MEITDLTCADHHHHHDHHLHHHHPHHHHHHAQVRGYFSLTLHSPVTTTYHGALLLSGALLKPTLEGAHTCVCVRVV